MKAVVSCLDIVFTILEIFWIFFIIDIIFERKYLNDFFERKRYIVPCFSIIFCSVSIICMNYIVLVSPYTLVVMTFLLTIFTRSFWKSDIQSVFAIIGGYIFLTYVYSCILIVLINMAGSTELLNAITTKKGIERLIFLVVYHIVWTIINLGIIRIIRIKTLNAGTAKRYVYILVMGIIGCLYFSVQLLNSFHIQMNIMLYMFLLIMATLIYGSYYKFQKETYQKEKELLLEHAGLLEKNYEQLNSFYIENAKLYHDMNHHFDMVYHLLDTEELFRAKEYIEGIMEPLKEKQIPVRSGIDILDVVLYEMEKKRKKSMFCLMWIYLYCIVIMI